jgi:hypothetical protein
MVCRPRAAQLSDSNVSSRIRSPVSLQIVGYAFVAIEKLVIIAKPSSGWLGTCHSQNAADASTNNRERRFAHASCARCVHQHADRRD